MDASKIRQIAYQEGIFTFNNIYDAKKPISVDVSPVMRKVAFDENILALQLTVRYFQDETEILKYGGITHFYIENWRELEKDEREFNSFKYELWMQALGFFRGIVTEKVKGTEIEQFFIPALSYDNVAKLPIKESKKN